MKIIRNIHTFILTLILNPLNPCIFPPNHHPSYPNLEICFLISSRRLIFLPENISRQTNSLTLILSLVHNLYKYNFLKFARGVLILDSSSKNGSLIQNSLEMGAFGFFPFRSFIVLFRPFRSFIFQSLKKLFSFVLKIIFNFQSISFVFSLNDLSVKSSSSKIVSLVKPFFQ